MRLLLDTHALLFGSMAIDAISLKARRAIASDSNAILVSAASAWEITTKARLGKLPGATDVAACVAGQGFLSLDITLLHAQRAGSLPGAHRDPFDRMLIAPCHKCHTCATRVQRAPESEHSWHMWHLWHPRQRPAVDRRQQVVTALQNVPH